MAVHTVTVHYELKFEFPNIPEGVDLRTMTKMGDGYDPSVDQWDLSYFDSDLMKIPSLYVYYIDGRKVSFKGRLAFKNGLTVEISE